MTRYMNVEKLLAGNPDLEKRNRPSVANHSAKKGQKLTLPKLAKPKLPLLIKPPYISCLSVNHFKFGYYTKKEVRQWMNSLAFEIAAYGNREQWKLVKLPLHITIGGVFSDKRKRDVHNFAKCILDSVESGTGINDQFFCVTTDVAKYEKGIESFLTILIEESKE